jgi:hypothetical protein
MVPNQGNSSKFFDNLKSRFPFFILKMSGIEIRWFFGNFLSFFSFDFDFFFFFSSLLFFSFSTTAIQSFFLLIFCGDLSRELLQ